MWNNTQSSLYSKNIIFQTMLLSICWSNIRDLWKRLLHTQSIYRFFQSLSYYWSFNVVKKLEMYGVNSTNLSSSKSYLNGRKQYIKITECADTLKKYIKCRVLQGSILGPLLLLLYVNGLPSPSNVLFTMLIYFFSKVT